MEVIVIGGEVAYGVARGVVRQLAVDTARTAARMPCMGHLRMVSLETLEAMPADTLEIVEGDEVEILRENGWGPVAIERAAKFSLERPDVFRPEQFANQANLEAHACTTGLRSSRSWVASACAP